MFSETFFWLLLILLVVYQGYVSRLILRSTAYSRTQKLWQIIVIWLLPLAGAVAAHWFATAGVSALPLADHNFEPQRSRNDGA